MLSPGPKRNGDRHATTAHRPERTFAVIVNASAGALIGASGPEDAIRAAFSDQGLTPLFIGKEAGDLQARVACARDSGAAAIEVAGGDGTVACAARVSGNAEIAEELRYGLNHWDGLTRFLDDGRIDLDTNSARSRKIGACVASLVETCKVNDVDPQTYFADVLASSSLSGPSRASTNSCPGPGPSRAP